MKLLQAFANYSVDCLVSVNFGVCLAVGMLSHTIKIGVVLDYTRPARRALVGGEGKAIGGL